jgi:cation diffusion facilitator CzcD-associated flavoprotein CzcO
MVELTDLDADHGFDPDALREKYRVERDKRLRPDGNDQYIEVKGDFSHYVDDPYVEPDLTRESLSDTVEVLVIGGGFAGLSAAAHLKMIGITDLRIIERGGDFGGTWYWNRYPGAQCDIESYVYLPLLEETGYLPREKYSFGPEIWEHAIRIAKQYDLYKGAIFQTQVLELRWLEEEGVWLATTNRKDRLKARFVVQTNGSLDRPKLPAIPGVGDFKGHTFHTSRWDYDYTGGDTTGGLTKLADKRVAIIGTGATAIQSVPHLGRYAERFYVVQRTPSSVDERRNGPTDPEWAKTLTPGWQARRRANFVSLTSGGYEEEDLVRDGWTDTVRSIGGFFAKAVGDLSPEDMKRVAEIADFRKMNQIRARVDAIVQDRETAEALKPWYRQFCKRPTFNDDYLPTFNRPNVTLLDTDGRGPDRISEKGIVVRGVEYDVDCIIFATGFEVGTAYDRRSGHEIYGRGDKALSKEWAKGLRTLHGFYSHDFPNLLHMGISQNGVSYAVTYFLDEQARHIAEVLKHARLRQARTIEPTSEAEREWVSIIRNKGPETREFQKQCTPGYYNNEGKVGETVGLIDEVYDGSPIEFYERVRTWRTDGMPGLEVA